jgi:uridine kinase
VPSESEAALVVAIAGPSGCGKTSLVKALAARLDAAALFFDDWADDPPGMQEWAHLPGADFGRWQTPGFSWALAELKSGAPVTVPVLSPSVGLDRSPEVSPTAVIVIEEPFGRLRPEMAGSIDRVFSIDVPLEIALARRLSRQVGGFLAFADAVGAEQAPALLRQGLASVDEYLDAYLDWGHGVYVEQLRQLRETSDRVLDGRLATDELASLVLGELEA